MDDLWLFKTVRKVGFDLGLANVVIHHVQEFHWYCSDSKELVSVPYEGGDQVGRQKCVGK